MNQVPLARAAALGPFVRVLQDLNIPVGRHLAAVNIPPELVCRGEGVITKHQMYKFLNRIQTREGIDDLGYRTEAELTPSSIGELAEAILASETLHDAIETFNFLINSWATANRIWLEQERGYTWVCNSANDGFALERDAANQFALQLIVELIRLAAGHDWRPHRVRLESKPSRAHLEVDALGDAEVAYHPTITAVAFPTRLLSAPLLSRPTNPNQSSVTGNALNDEFLPALEVLLSSRLLVGNLPSLQATAHIVGTSPRTLQRDLAKQGLNYRRFVDRIRFRRARELLRDSTHSLDDIAPAVGYTDRSNFIRSFRRIAGCSPTEYRKRIQ